ncbi:RISC-loading complex subunit tarbp2-like [Branchiostoma floridae]|uniref:RISC-loading complex subunit tarbp2-like n=1 Tax=Branchiostoma floridae TaxID=7739 RepID=A0A9J7N354_BRAFL|nr:RISC-loading complex subunit tarbp2-like [Branchiostoma floridae]
MSTMGHQKTPISLLQELSTHMGKTAQYDLIATEGAAHQQTFVFRVTVGEVVATGAGLSKKAAKHKAAESALNIIQGKVTPEEANNMSHLHTAAGEQSTYSESGGVLTPPDNPIGQLQELVVERGWRLPEYIVISEQGPPHCKEFTIQVKVEKFKDTGTGSSKKAAKRSAAGVLLTRLREIPPDQQDMVRDADIDEDSVPFVVRDSKTGVKPMHAARIGITWATLRNSAGEKITRLKSTSLSTPNSNYCQLLQELAEEQNFEVEYLDIAGMFAAEELSASSLHQCLVQLTTQPVTVCHGQGHTRDEAHAHAAHNALQYLKLMVRRA